MLLYGARSGSIAPMVDNRASHSGCGLSRAACVSDTQLLTLLQPPPPAQSHHLPPAPPGVVSRRGGLAGGTPKPGGRWPSVRRGADGALVDQRRVGGVK